MFGSSSPEFRALFLSSFISCPPPYSTYLSAFMASFSRTLTPATRFSSMHVIFSFSIRKFRICCILGPFHSSYIRSCFLSSFIPPKSLRALRKFHQIQSYYPWFFLIVLALKTALPSSVIPFDGVLSTPSAMSFRLNFLPPTIPKQNWRLQTLNRV